MGMKLVYHPLSRVINKRFNTLFKKKQGLHIPEILKIRESKKVDCPGSIVPDFLENSYDKVYSEDTH